MEISGEALEPAHRFGITVRSHRHVMCTIAHIDSRGLRMDYLQARVLRLQPPREFLLRFAVSPQLFLRPHPCSPRWEFGFGSAR
jgi:hypothetical protein